MKKGVKVFIWIAVIILLLVGIGFFVNYYVLSPFGNSVAQEFDLDTLFLKVALKEGGQSSNNIKITNTNHAFEKFSIQINEISDLVSLDEYNFDLEPDKTKTIRVMFNTSDKNSGVYLGALKISSDGNIKEIPIILEIETKEVLFDGNLNLFPQATNIIAGQRLNAQLKVFDLTTKGLGKSNLELTYVIKSFDGRNIVSETENIVVDGQYDYSRSIDLPKTIRLGNYVLYTLLKYKNSTGTSSTFFKVVDEQASSQQSSEKLIYLIIGLFGFFFLIFLGLFVYSLIFRDNMLKEIRRQYQGEIRRQKKMIECQRQQDYSNLKTSEEKKQYKKELEEIKRLRLSALKEVRNKKIVELKIIKQKFKGNKLKTQLNKWKREGYDTQVLEKKYKLPKVKDIRTKINKWKKQGYDTTVLNPK